MPQSLDSEDMQTVLLPRVQSHSPTKQLKVLKDRYRTVRLEFKRSACETSTALSVLLATQRGNLFAQIDRTSELEGRGDVLDNHATTLALWCRLLAGPTLAALFPVWIMSRAAARDAVVAVAVVLGAWLLVGAVILVLFAISGWWATTFVITLPILVSVVFWNTTSGGWKWSLLLVEIVVYLLMLITNAYFSEDLANLDYITALAASGIVVTAITPLLAVIVWRESLPSIGTISNVVALSYAVFAVTVLVLLIPSAFPENWLTARWTLWVVVFSGAVLALVPFAQYSAGILVGVRAGISAALAAFILWTSVQIAASAARVWFSRWKVVKAPDDEIVNTMVTALLDLEFEQWRGSEDEWRKSILEIYALSTGTITISPPVLRRLVDSTTRQGLADALCYIANVLAYGLPHHLSTGRPDVQRTLSHQFLAMAAAVDGWQRRVLLGSHEMWPDHRERLIRQLSYALNGEWKAFPRAKAGTNVNRRQQVWGALRRLFAALLPGMVIVLVLATGTKLPATVAGPLIAFAVAWFAGYALRAADPKAGQNLDFIGKVAGTVDDVSSTFQSAKRSLTGT